MIKKTIGIVLIPALLAPTVLFAQTNTPEQQPRGAGIETTQLRNQEQMCSRFDTFQSRVQERFELAKGALNGQMDRIRTRSEERLESKEDQIGEVQGQRDNALEQSYENMRQRIQTEEQRTAVEEFIGNLDAALERHRDRISQILDDTQDVDDQLLESEEKVQAAMNKYQGDVDASLTRAKSQCLESESTDAVRQLGQSLREEITQSGEEYRNALKNEAEETRVRVQARLQSSRTSAETSRQQLREDVLQAREQLKKALGVSTTDSDPVDESDGDEMEEAPIE